MGQGAHDYSRELEVALEASAEAIEAIMAVYAEAGVAASALGVEEKSDDRGPVTEADTRANAIFVSAISRAFPDDAILAEESEDDPRRLSAERFWCIDPLDGTKEFIKRNGEFSSMIGLVDRASGRPLLGVVIEPVRGLTMYAIKGQGAYRLDEDGSRVRLEVSQNAADTDVRIIVSRSHPDPQTMTVVERMTPASLTPCGSVGVKIGRIVEDAADVYLNFSGRTRFWDTCAPDIILSEAGGRLTHLDGAPINYSKASTVNDVPFVASNGACHQSVLAHSVAAQKAHTT